ncbi:MAG: ATP-dependent Clp protease proteolytic subunit [Spirochaetales bacterium]|jgi:ATP-dependent Clp protease protease subunit|nr:ATP-dependent Clp protease proteolytic subunit [Spirochaetales bacterium]
MARFEDEDEKAKEKDKDGESEAVFQKLLKTRTLLVSGEIDKSLAEKTIRGLLLLEADGDGPIKIFIDSPGGDVDAGYAIIDMMKFVGPDVWTVGMGLVASAGALILLGSPKERRVGLPHSHYLIHQPLSGLRGVATEIEIHARELERVRERLNHFIADETGKPYEQVVKDTDRDFWMNAEDALAYGLVSRIVTHRAEFPV